MSRRLSFTSLEMMADMLLSFIISRVLLLVGSANRISFDRLKRLGGDLLLQVGHSSSYERVAEQTWKEFFKQHLSK